MSKRLLIILRKSLPSLVVGNMLSLSIEDVKGRPATSMITHARALLCIGDFMCLAHPRTRCHFCQTYGYIYGKKLQKIKVVSLVIFMCSIAYQFPCRSHVNKNNLWLVVKPWPDINHSLPNDTLYLHYI